MQLIRDHGNVDMAKMKKISLQNVERVQDV